MMLFLWQLAAVLSGSSVGLLGAYLVGFRMPFLAISISHAAMAGAVFAHLLGWPITPVALAAALCASMLVGALGSGRSRIDLNTLTSMLLSLTMALALLGIGLSKGDRSPLLSLMWGSLLFVRQVDVFLIALMALVFVLFLALYRKELGAMLFSRTLARSCGVDDTHVMMVFLAISSAIVTVNIQIVGGLLMYSLLTNPAAAAYELGRSVRGVGVLSLTFGLLSALGGFWFSYLFDLPTGSCIVLASCAIYAGSVVFSRNRSGNQ